MCLNIFMDTITVRKLNEVYVKLETTKSIEMDLNGYFAEFADNYIFHPKYRCGRWDGKIRAFNPSDKLLPFGLLPKLSTYCKANNIKLNLQLNVDELFNNIEEEELYDLYDTIFSKESGIYPRDYQHTAILKSLMNKRGITLAATGSGKSNIIYSISRYLLSKNKVTILIVPNVSLVNQMYSDFQEYGWNDIDKHVSKLYSGLTPDFTKPMLITTWQSIQTKHPEFFKRYDGLILDETHNVRGLEIQNICKKLVNADYRLGFTGTMPPNKADFQTVTSFLGQIIFNISAKELMDRDVLSQIKINNLVLKYDKQYCVNTRDYDSEMKFINSYDKRMSVLNHIIDKNKERENTLFLVHKIDHLKSIEEYLKQHYGNTHSVYVIFGEVKADERELIRKKINDEGNVLLVATYATASTGLNIPRLHNVVFFSSYKSKIKILQSIGRGLRKHDTKDGMLLWDVVDDLRYSHGSKNVDNYVYRHFKSRKQYYEEQGFEFSDSQLKI